MLGNEHCIQSKPQLCDIKLECVQHVHWCAGEAQGRGVGLRSASTSSLQHVHDEGMNGSSGFAHHPAHVRTASVADSADEAAQASGELFNFVRPACICCRTHDHLPTWPQQSSAMLHSTLLGCPPCQVQEPQTLISAKRSGHAGHGNAIVDVWNSQGDLCDIWPAPLHGTIFAAQDHHERKSRVMAYPSTGYIGAKEAVLSLLSSCLQYRSR